MDELQSDSRFTITENGDGIQATLAGSDTCVRQDYVGHVYVESKERDACVEWREAGWYAPYVPNSSNDEVRYIYVGYKRFSGNEARHRAQKAGYGAPFLFLGLALCAEEVASW